MILRGPQRLATDTLPGMERADRPLQKHSRKNPRADRAQCVRVARSSFGQGGCGHGVVNCDGLTVGDLKNWVPSRLTNAVLRKIAPKGLEGLGALRSPPFAQVACVAPLAEAGPRQINRHRSRAFAGAR